MAGRAAQRRRQRDDERRIQPRGIGGREVLGQQDRRHRGQRDARLGEPAEFGDDPVADVAQIGDAFGHQPAELGEEVDELIDGRHHRAHGGDPALMCFSAAPNHARSCASVAVAASTSDAAPVAWAARSRSRVATAPAAAVNRAASAGPFRLVDIGRGLDLVEYRNAAGPDHRSVLQSPATTGTPCRTVPAGRSADSWSEGSDVDGDEAVM